MKKMQKTRYVLLGALITVLIGQLVSPALAALTQKTIDVYTGVDIYVDDVLLEPTDADGNSVEPFVYNGTTYLPVRAVGEAVGKVVQWEGSTQSVYLGKHTSDTPAVWLEDLDYFTGSDLFACDIAKDNLGNTHTHVVRCHARDNTYKINGQYSKITGTLFMMYDYRSSSSTASLKIFGDGELLYFAEIAAGIEPISFEVNLSGVLELEIIIDNTDGSGSAIGEFGLYT